QALERLRSQVGGFIARQARELRPYDAQERRALDAPPCGQDRAQERRAQTGRQARDAQAEAFGQERFARLGARCDAESSRREARRQNSRKGGQATIERSHEDERRENARGGKAATQGSIETCEGRSGRESDAGSNRKTQRWRDRRPPFRETYGKGVGR